MTGEKVVLLVPRRMKPARLLGVTGKLNKRPGQVVDLLEATVMLLLKQVMSLKALSSKMVNMKKLLPLLVLWIPRRRFNVDVQERVRSETRSLVRTPGSWCANKYRSRTKKRGRGTGPAATQVVMHDTCGLVGTTEYCCCRFMRCGHGGHSGPICACPCRRCSCRLYGLGQTPQRARPGLRKAQGVLADPTVTVPSSFLAQPEVFRDLLIG